MEKFGVEQDEPAVKTAETKNAGACPVCRSRLQPRELSNVLVCPKCGTKPFEGSEK